MKWVGGKRQIADQLASLIPARYGTYHEPFVGGGALFFHVGPRRAVLSDDNERLVRTYRGIRDSVDQVVELLRGYPHDRTFFEQLRERPPDGRSDAEVAAWMVYLNKTAFNGLYRVNSRNVFNVPFGRYERPAICDEPNLRACAHELRRAEVHRDPFTKVLERAQKGDFVYFDPPYVPLSATSSFTAYTKDGFGLEEHIQLRDVAKALKKRGVHVLVSNSSADLVRELYRGFEMHEVRVRRSVNSDATRRGAVPELVLR